LERWLSRFTTQDLLIIAIIAALGLAMKPVITPLVHLISAPLLIPGGSLAGGFYMLWFGLIVVLVPRKGSALLVALVQGIVTLIIGHFGHHGVMSILIYTAPGLTVEVIALFFRNRSTLIAQTIICSGANLVGSLLVALLIMRLPFIPLILSLTAAVVSGIGGGIVSYTVIRQLKAYRFELLREKS